MTLTTPIPLARYDLGADIATGLRPVTHTARIHPAVLEPYRASRSRGIVDPGPATAQLTAAQARITRAITRTLDAHDIPLDAGRVTWMLDRTEQHWTLSGTWLPH